jgi:hypothetical protein
MNVGFEILSAATTMYVTLCGTEVHRLFGGVSANFYQTTRLHAPADNTLQTETEFVRNYKENKCKKFILHFMPKLDSSDMYSTSIQKQTA